MSTRAERLKAARRHAEEHLAGVMAEVRLEALERHAAGEKKATIARDLGVSRPTINKWLSGECEDSG